MLYYGFIIQHDSISREQGASVAGNRISIIRSRSIVDKMLTINISLRVTYTCNAEFTVIISFLHFRIMKSSYLCNINDAFQ